MSKTLDRFKNRHWTSDALFILVTTWIVLFARLVIRRHNSFQTFDFDLGIHTQSIWLLAHGEWFNTICGLPVFGHHAVFVYYLFVPFVWLGGGANLWNTFQVCAMGLAAVPIFYIAFYRLKSRFAALAFSCAWLLLPTTGFLVWETLHPEALATPFLLTGYYYALTHNEPAKGRFTRNALAYAWLTAAVLCKEDIALAVLGIGIIMLVKKHWRFGATITVAAATYFLIIGVWMVPTLAGELSTYGGLYGELGTTPFNVAKNSLLHPTQFFGRLGDNNAVGYAGQIMSPLAFMSLLSPLTLIIAVPQYFINILTTADFTWAMMYHYQVVPVVGAIVAAIDGVSFIQRRSRILANIGVAAVLFASYTAAVHWGNSPIGDKYTQFSWGSNTPWIAGWTAALNRIGPDDIASVHYSLIPHATHRKVIYTFPNPWLNSNFNTPERFVDPDLIKWIVVANVQMSPEVNARLNELIASGEFGDAESVNGVTSYRRLRPATPTK